MSQVEFIIEQVEFIIEQLKKLEGYTITGTATDPDGEFPAFVCKKGELVKVVFILADDQGNGPGSVEIQNV
jgi:hypothetical protein